METSIFSSLKLVCVSAYYKEVHIYIPDCTVQNLNNPICLSNKAKCTKICKTAATKIKPKKIQVDVDNQAKV